MNRAAGWSIGEAISKGLRGVVVSQSWKTRKPRYVAVKPHLARDDRVVTSGSQACIQSVIACEESLLPGQVVDCRMEYLV